MDEIGSLERRHKELVKILARVDPQVYVTKLQRELARLQEQNRILKSTLPVPQDSPLVVLPEGENPQVEIVAELEQEEIVAHQDDAAMAEELSNQPDSSSEGQGHGTVDVDGDEDEDAEAEVEVDGDVEVEVGADSTMQNPALVFNSPDSTN